jgi:hypothetical protein
VVGRRRPVVLLCGIQPCYGDGMNDLNPPTLCYLCRHRLRPGNFGLHMGRILPWLAQAAVALLVIDA